MSLLLLSGQAATNYSAAVAEIVTLAEQLAVQFVHGAAVAETVSLLDYINARQVPYVNLLPGMCGVEMRDPYELVQGESRHWVLTVRQRASGTALDITDAAVYLTVRARIEDVTTLILLRNAAAGGSNAQIQIRSQVDNDIGRVDIYTVPSDTINIQPSSMYVIDAWVVLPTGEHRPVILSRRFAIIAATTRRF